MKPYNKQPKIFIMDSPSGCKMDCYVTPINSLGRSKINDDEDDPYNYFAKKINDNSLMLVPVQSFGITEQYVLIRGKDFSEKRAFYKGRFDYAKKLIQYSSGAIESFFTKLPSEDTPIDIKSCRLRLMDYMSFTEELNFASFINGIEGLNEYNRRNSIQDYYDFHLVYLKNDFYDLMYKDCETKEEYEENEEKRREYLCNSLEKAPRITYFDYIIKDLPFTYIFRYGPTMYFSNGQEPAEYDEVFVFAKPFKVWKRFTRKQYKRFRGITKIGIEMIKVDTPIRPQQRISGPKFEASSFEEILEMNFYAANRLQADRILYEGNVDTANNFFGKVTTKNDAGEDAVFQYPGFYFDIKRFDNEISLCVTARELGISIPWDKAQTSATSILTNFDIFRIQNMMMKIHDAKLEYNYANYGCIKKYDHYAQSGRVNSDKQTFISIESYLKEANDGEVKVKRSKDKSKDSKSGSVSKGRKGKNKK